MDITTFIFSRSRNIIFLRHAIFWMVWILFYTAHLVFVRTQNAGASLPFSTNLFSSFVNILSTTVIDMAYVYTIIYMLIPGYFFRGRFLLFFLSWLLLTLVTAYSFRLQTEWMILPMDAAFGFPARKLAPLPTAIFSLSISIGFEGCMAAAIVLGKNWYRSNQHLLRVQQENHKMNQSLKHSQKLLGSHEVVRDIFLDLSKEIDRMNCAGEQVDSVKSKSSCIMAFLNTYFETPGNGVVSLTHELDGLKKFLSIKELEDYQFDNYFSNSRPENKIASHILLPLTALPYKNEAAINRSRKIKMDVHTQGDHVVYSLSWHKKNIRDNLEKGQFEFLNAIKKYLEFNYPRSHQLSVSINDSIISILLNIRLRESL